MDAERPSADAGATPGGGGSRGGGDGERRGSSGGRGGGESHEQLRVLSIRGTAYCNSDCIFCVEKYIGDNLIAPAHALTRELIASGAGKYNMLFFMNGEPTLDEALFDHVALAREHGFRHFGMSSHFRTFADPAFAQRVLEAGFRFFDISLHAATLVDQERVNAIGDGGRSLTEALDGLRNLYTVGRRLGVRPAVTHKIVMSGLNYAGLYPIFRATYDLGVRSYVLQPVKVSGLRGERTAALEVTEAQLVPHINTFLQRIDDTGVTVKLYGLSRLGIAESRVLVQEENVIRHFHGKQRRNRIDNNRVDGVLAAELAAESRPSEQAVYRITVRHPILPEATFECGRDEVVLNAGLAKGVFMPFGCRMGSCGLCCGQVREGHLEQGPQDVLDEELRGQGYALLCQARPRSDLVIELEKEGELGL